MAYRDRSPIFATTIAIHIELRIEKHVVLEKNYLSETQSAGESGALWATDASLARAIALGTGDMTSRVTRDVVRLIDCGSLACIARPDAAEK